MLSFTQKFALGIITAIAFALLFTSYKIYLSKFITLSKNLETILEFIIFSVPFFFFLINLEDASIGLLSGFLYKTVEKTTIALLLVEPICFFDIFIFGIAFSVFSFTIAFFHENSMKNVRLSLIGSFALFLAFCLSIFILLVYSKNYPEGVGCFYLQKYFLRIFLILQTIKII